jgi:FkbM family methyltransferase
MPIIQGPLRGSKWIAGAGNHGCWLGSYEQQKGAAIVRAISPGDVFYDIGANAGYYTLLGSRITGKVGHVYSFEPLPLNLSFLRKHIQLNSIENSSVLEVAVAAVDGVAAFTIGENSCEGHLTAATGIRTIQVKTASLDSLVSNNAIRPPKVIKCDIEGGEYDALQGAREVLRRYSPVLFLATHGPEIHRKCVQLLLELDFEVRDLDGGLDGATDEIVAVSRYQPGPT